MHIYIYIAICVCVYGSDVACYKNATAQGFSENLNIDLLLDATCLVVNGCVFPQKYGIYVVNMGRPQNI